MSMAIADRPQAQGLAKPRLGFLGAGWIGRHRMKAVLDAGVAEAAAIAEPSEECMWVAKDIAPSAKQVETLEALLREDVNGIVIATPSALHAHQAIQALGQGVPVFCQKPLGRTHAEVRAVVDAAANADCLLGADFSYRHTDAMRRIRPVVAEGGIGRVHAVDLTFHNAYGPDKPWFYDPASSGGGCLIDLGVHLVDLALWALDFPDVVEVESHLFAKGEKLPPDPSVVEDFAVATLTLGSGTIVRLTCSWGLHAGQDAQIAAAFYGTEGGLALRNIDGSFYDFVAERYRGTAREILSEPPDPWGGRAIVEWARRLSETRSFDRQAEQFVEVAGTIDRIYGRDLHSRYKLRVSAMSELPNQEIEGRLNAQREVLAFLIAHLARLENGGSEFGNLLGALEKRMQYQDYQEDPGAVPAGPAFAIEGATMREFDLIVREARARLAGFDEDN